MGDFFEMKINSKPETIAISPLYTSGGLSSPNCVYVGCGFYDKDLRWDGRSISGNIPYKELLRWGIEKNYLQIEQ